MEPGLNQPRKRFDEEALQDLADSIRIHGVIQPLTVRRLSSGYYQIIAGERRWRAAKLAGLEEVPAVIIEADDRKVMELGLIENLQREDLNPIEEAKGYKVLMSEYGLTQEEVAQRVGKSRPAVANALRLLALPDPVHLLLEEGKLSAGHARAILAVPSGELQKKLAQKVVEEELSVRQTEALAKRLAAGAQKSPRSPRPPPARTFHLYLQEAEKALASRFGPEGVTLSTAGKKGKMELEYYNPEDLNALLELLEQPPRREGRCLPLSQQDPTSRSRRPPSARRGAREAPTNAISVLLYLAILFAAAFLLLLMSYFMQQRANQAALDNLQRPPTGHRPVPGEHAPGEREPQRSRTRRLQAQVDALEEQVKQRPDRHRRDGRPPEASWTRLTYLNQDPTPCTTIRGDYADCPGLGLRRP